MMTVVPMLVQSVASGWIEARPCPGLTTVTGGSRRC